MPTYDDLCPDPTGFPSLTDFELEAADVRRRVDQATEENRAALVARMDAIERRVARIEAILDIKE